MSCHVLDDAARVGGSDCRAVTGHGESQEDKSGGAERKQRNLTWDNHLDGSASRRGRPSCIGHGKHERERDNQEGQEACKM